MEVKFRYEQGRFELDQVTSLTDPDEHQVTNLDNKDAPADSKSPPDGTETQAQGLLEGEETGEVSLQSPVLVGSSPTTAAPVFNPEIKPEHIAPGQ